MIITITDYGLNGKKTGHKEIQFDNEQISDCICMGIRHGLFNDAKESFPDNSSALSDIAMAIQELAAAVRNK